ncbi:MAG: sulfatase [Planctomycetes bacterium]|nr:sulfatase [Planctomycetota bacterium]
MNPLEEYRQLMTRRALLGRCAGGVGAAALAAMMGETPAPQNRSGLVGVPHHPPRAKRIIHLFMSGAPSQIDLWDEKPELEKLYDKDLPESVVGAPPRPGAPPKKQRFTTMTSGQKRFPIAPSIYKFRSAGDCGMRISELLPHTAGVVDDLCVIRSLWTDAINHDPAMTFVQTGHEQPGRPSFGSWISYGLGSLNDDLPAYVSMTATWTGRRDAQALFSRLWGTGFLSSEYQGVALRAKGDAVLYLENPPGIDRPTRRRMLDSVSKLNQHLRNTTGDPEIDARTAQYEMAFRMQKSVPDLMDISGEPEHILESYGPDVKKKGTFAASCLLARRLAERDVRFVQIWHRGWDQHGNLTGDLPKQCRDVDQPCAALINDLKQRGMLDDTLVVWTTEFGRTTYCQGRLSRKNYGRDHHPRCFTAWMAGGGVKGGTQIGATDDFSYNIVEDPVHVHDMNATMMHLLGIDHERLVHRYQGRDFRLTDVHGRVVNEALA